MQNKPYKSTEYLFDPNVQQTEVMNLATGHIAPKHVNVHMARDVGISILDSMVGQNPLTLTIKKSPLAVQIPTKYAVNVAEFNNAGNGVTNVDPQLLFQRALLFAGNEDIETSLEECLSYKLCPVSMPLFDKDGFMRSNNKADLMTWLVEDCILDVDNLDMLKNPDNQVVLDGGALLHRVGWTKTDQFSQIIQNYHGYISNLVGGSLAPSLLLWCSTVICKAPPKTIATRKGNQYQHSQLTFLLISRSSAKNRCFCQIQTISRTSLMHLDNP